jgi:putative endonuclease
MSKQSTGQTGEALALAHLMKQGYRLIETNWRCRQGELDIVTRHNDVIVFIEVRSRHSATVETAFETITPRKRDKLIKLAQLYLESHELNEATWRIDVIAVSFPRSDVPTLEHVEDALDW